MTETPLPNIADPQTVYQVRDFVDAAQLKRDLAFSDNDLSSAMMTQAAMFSHYGVLAADASRQVDVVKLLLESTEATVYKTITDEKIALGEKPTVAMLEALVAKHPRVITLKKALNEAKRIESICKTAVEAFRHRRDMLVQMGLISREEMKGSLSIMEKRAREEATQIERQNTLDAIHRLRASGE